MKIYICVALVGLIIAATEAALQCYQCSNARSEAECNAAGPQDCPANALMCENLVRTRNGQSLYFKRCKQDLACGNNVKGNTNGPQCKPGDPIHSECWCCCNGENGCNEEALPCVEGPNDEEPSCQAPPEVPFGKVDCCGNDVLDDGTFPLGSTCTYTCDQDENNPKTTVCQKISEDSNVAVFSPLPPSCPSTPEPTCEKLHDIENGRVDCSESKVREDGTYPLGSTCTYTCDPGLQEIGQTITTCEKTFENSDVAVFLPFPPTCTPTCSRPQGIENGFFECDDSLPNLSYELDSNCYFFCSKGYALKGSYTRTCELVEGSTASAEFQPENPRCITCEEIEQITNGKVDCTNENKIESKCTFTCDEGYLINPKNAETTECLMTATWSKPTPCCVKECSPDRKIDFVLTLDSSGSISETNWDAVKRFSANFVRNLKISRDAAQVGVFNFDKVVVDQAQILLNDYSDDSIALIREIELLRFRGGKRGTNTGVALRHARDVMFTKGNGDREDAINTLLVITDGNSKDPALVKEQSKALRDDGVLIYVIGINAEKGINFVELTEMAGSVDQVFELENFDELSETLATDLGKRICQDASCP